MLEKLFNEGKLLKELSAFRERFDRLEARFERLEARIDATESADRVTRGRNPRHQSWPTTDPSCFVDSGDYDGRRMEER